MTVAALSLGSNLGDRHATIAGAVARLADAGLTILRRSHDYETPPWGPVPQGPFINACLLVETNLTAPALLALCLRIEQEAGRRRDVKWGPRTLDIDILTFGDETIDTPDLVVPHPRMWERAFVMEPLREIAPDLVVGGRRVGDVPLPAG